jgi:hypothetical protein
LTPVDLVVLEDLAVEDGVVRTEGEFLHVPDSTTGIVRRSQPMDLDRAGRSIGGRCSWWFGGLALCLNVLLLSRLLFETHDDAELMC